MVFTSLINFGARNKARAPNKGPDEIWRKRRIFKMAAVSKAIPYQKMAIIC